MEPLGSQTLNRGNKKRIESESGKKKRIKNPVSSDGNIGTERRKTVDGNIANPRRER